jgi:hypothetical protein
MLARRLRGRGVELTGAALAAALAADTATAEVPATLLRGTARAATGRLTAASAPAVFLMKGVMQAMLMRKLKLTVVAILVTAALGALGLACRSGEEARAQDLAARAGDGKPLSELEALRRENQRLRKNIEILLDRISAQDATMKAQAQAARTSHVWDVAEAVDAYNATVSADLAAKRLSTLSNRVALRHTLGEAAKKAADPTQEVEAALKTWREARDPAARRSAAQALERAIQHLRQQVDPEAAPKK